MSKTLQDSIKTIQEELKNIEKISKQDAIANNKLVEKSERNYYFLRDRLLIWEIDFSIIYKLFKKNKKKYNFYIQDKNYFFLVLFSLFDKLLKVFDKFIETFFS